MSETFRFDGAKLTDSQQRVIKKILDRIHAFGEAERKRQREARRNSDRHRSSRYEDRITARSEAAFETFNFFVVDGARGTGKSTLVRSVCELAPYLGVSTPKGIDPKIFENELWDRKQDLQTTWPLLTIYPDMFVGPETELPDVLFDQIREDLTRDADRLGRVREDMTYRSRMDPYEDSSRMPWDDDFHPDQKAKEANALLEELRTGIDPGWTYARNIGRDVLGRDSINYREFVFNKGKYSALSSRRHTLWRDFLEKYLDYKGAALLLVPIDDCDLSPNIAPRLIRDLRLYLSHPRVVVVTAMDMEAMTDVLKLANYREVSAVFQGLDVADLQKFDPELLDQHQDLRGQSSAHRLRQSQLKLAEDLYDIISRGAHEVTELEAKVFPKYLRSKTPPNSLTDIEQVLFGRSLDFENEISTMDPTEHSEKSHAVLYYWRSRRPKLLRHASMRQLIAFKRTLSANYLTGYGYIRPADFLSETLLDDMMEIFAPVEIKTLFSLSKQRIRPFDVQRSGDGKLMVVPATDSPFMYFAADAARITHGTDLSDRVLSGTAARVIEMLNGDAVLPLVRVVSNVTDKDPRLTALNPDTNRLSIAGNFTPFPVNMTSLRDANEILALAEAIGDLGSDVDEPVTLSRSAVQIRRDVLEDKLDQIVKGSTEGRTLFDNAFLQTRRRDGDLVEMLLRNAGARYLMGRRSRSSGLSAADKRKIIASAIEDDFDEKDGSVHMKMEAGFVRNVYGNAWYIRTAARSRLMMALIIARSCSELWKRASTPLKDPMDIFGLDNWKSRARKIAIMPAAELCDLTLEILTEAHDKLDPRDALLLAAAVQDSALVIAEDNRTEVFDAALTLLGKLAGNPVLKASPIRQPSRDEFFDLVELHRELTKCFERYKTNPSTIPGYEDALPPEINGKQEREIMKWMGISVYEARAFLAYEQSAAADDA